jgi:hypothetical protein
MPPSKTDEPLAFLVSAMSRLIWGQAGLPYAYRQLLTCYTCYSEAQFA